MGHEVPWLRAAAGGLPADPYAEEYRRGDADRRLGYGLRLRDDLVHLVAGGARVRSARSAARSGTPSTTTATSTSRPRRSRRSRARAPGCSGGGPDPMSDHTARGDRPGLLPGRRGTPRGGRVDQPRLLDLSDERLPDLRGPLRHLRRARRQPRRRPGPRDLFDLPLVALNTTFLLISSITYGFAMLAMHRCGPVADAEVAGDHRPLRGRLRRCRALRVRPPDPRGRRAAALGLPLGLLRAGRHPRAARHLRHRLADRR